MKTAHFSSIVELERLRKLGHHSCFACTHPELKLEFTLEEENVLCGTIDFSQNMTSFNGYVHGGLQALLLDEAMTCSLMAQGVYGATGDFNLRYRQSVHVGPTARIRAWMEKQYHSMYYMRAELLQNGKLCTFANARFMRKVLGSDDAQ